MSKKPLTKKLPLRTCIVTRQKLPKSDLIRLVKTPSGEVEIDLNGKKRGRGANIVPTIDAFDLAVSKGLIERALKIEKKLKPEQVEKLRIEYQQALEEKEFRPHNKMVKIRVKRSELEALNTK